MIGAARSPGGLIRRDLDARRRAGAHEQTVKPGIREKRGREKDLHKLMRRNCEASSPSPQGAPPALGAAYFRDPLCEAKTGGRDEAGVQVDGAPALPQQTMSENVCFLPFLVRRACACPRIPLSPTPPTPVCHGDGQPDPIKHVLSTENQEPRRRTFKQKNHVMPQSPSSTGWPARRHPHRCPRARRLLSESPRLGTPSARRRGPLPRL